MRPSYLRLLACGLLLVTLIDCRQPPSPDPSDHFPTRDDNMALGNPDGARTSEASPNVYLISRSTYSLSYNQSTGIANWAGRRCGELASISRLERISDPLRR